jgi:hypothetical protein
MEPGHGPTGQFDAAHLKAIHHHLFQDVFEWSGRTRDERVALFDGTIATEPSLRKIDGSAFVAGPIIPEALDRIAGSLRAANYLRGLSREEFAVATRRGRCEASAAVETVLPRFGKDWMRDAVRSHDQHGYFAPVVPPREGGILVMISGAGHGAAESLRT